jgi:hypothetical protein
VTESQHRAEWVQRIDVAHTAACSLPAQGPVRDVLSDAHVEEQRLRAQTDPDIEHALWPPLLMYAMQPWHTPEELRLLDADVTRIRDHSTGDPLHAVSWLAASPTEGRRWRAGYFETCMKAKALAAASALDEADVEFDVRVPGGRDVDIKLSFGDRAYFLECTIITESDEDQQVRSDWLELRKSQPNLPLARPGPFDPPSSKGPSPHYDANRIYMKVFDKLQKGGDPAKTQTSDDSPNVMLFSCWPNFGSPLPFSPALGWAFDELFGAQPNIGSVKQMPLDSAVKDLSLLRFLRREWPAAAVDLLVAPSRLSATLVFNCVDPLWSRVNHNAADSHRIANAEMALLESVFTRFRGWETLRPLPAWRSNH